MKNKVRAFFSSIKSKDIEDIRLTYQLLQDSNYFKKNREQVLGKAYQTTNQFSEMVTKIRGNRQDALDQIKVSIPAYIKSGHLENEEGKVPIAKEAKVIDLKKLVDQVMEELTLLKEASMIGQAA